MRIRCIKLPEQGIDFLVALVKHHVVNARAVDTSSAAIGRIEKFLPAPLALCRDISAQGG